MKTSGLIQDSVELNLKGSSTLIVSFGGIRQGLGIPVFEFYKILDVFDCDKIFIKDNHQAWYQRGVNKELNNVPKLLNYLQGIINKQAYKKVVFLGNSMGGFGAILFGVLLNVDRIIAFSPQTYINKLNRWYYRDKRWSKEVNAMYLSQKGHNAYFDLKVILKGRTFTGNINIYYSSTDRLDKTHVQRILSFNHVNSTDFNFGGHSLVRELKERNILQQIIADNFEKE